MPADEAQTMLERRAVESGRAWARETLDRILADSRPLVGGWPGTILSGVMIWFLLVFFCAELAIVLQWTSATLLMWAVFGMTGQAAILAYPWLSSYFGADLSGRANTAMNLLIFMSAFGVQYAIGEIIDFFPTTAAGGYDPRGYQIGFGVFAAAQLLALIWYFLGRSRLKA